MGISFSRVAKLPKAALLLVLPALFVIPLLHGSKAAAFDGDYAMKVVLSNPRTDVTITATRQASDPKTATFKGSGTTYTTDQVLRTNPTICNSDARSCTWNISVKDKTGAEIASATNQFITNRSGVDQFGSPTVNITVPAQGAAGSNVATVTGAATFVDIRDKNTTKPDPTNTLITFTQTAGGNNKYTTNPASCGTNNTGGVKSCGTYTLHNVAPGTYTVTLQGGYNGGSSDNLGISKTITGVVIKAGQNTVDLNQTANDAATAGSSTSTCKNKDANGNCTDAKADKALDCHSGALNWVVCPLIALASDASQTLDNFIMNVLDVDVGPIFDHTQDKNSASYGYYTAWNSFRVVATAVLVIAGLVMVTSQALGFEFLDAYTIRKTLPRLFVAAIGISLSWPLMRLAVSFFDTAGFDVRELIYAPFNHAPFSQTLGLKGGVLSGLALTGGLLVLGPTALTFLISIAISVFVGFVALVIREVFLIMLIIAAPVAIACYILPNTARVWKLWHENFLGLLLAFPLISAVVAAGHVFAAVANTNQSSVTLGAFGLVAHFSGHGFWQRMAADDLGSLTTTALAIVGYYGPDLMFVTILKSSIGWMSTFAANAPSALQRMDKYFQGKRSQAAANNLHAMKTGNRFKGDNWASRAFNRTTETVAAVPNAGFDPRHMKSRMQASMSQHQMAEAAEYGEKNQAFNVIKGNDDFLNAGIAGKGDDTKVRKYLQDMRDKDGNRIYSDAAVNQGVAAIRAARRDVNSEVFETAATMALPATGTAFKDGAGDMHAAINHVAGNDRVKAARMLAAMRGGASQARRFDLAGGGFGDQLATMEAQFSKDPAKHMTNQEASEHIFEASLEGQGGNYIAGARKSAVANLSKPMMKKLQTTIAANHDPNDAASMEKYRRGISQELATIAGRYDAMAHVSPENARVLADNVMNQEIEVEGVKATVRQHVEWRRPDPQFQEMRKEFQSAAESTAAAMQNYQTAQAQGQQAPPPGVPGGPPGPMPNFP